MLKVVALVVTVFTSLGTASAQQCVHGPDETPEQTVRRREALTAARTVNTIQVNQPGAVNRRFLSHADLAGAPFAKRMRDSTNDVVKRLSLVPGEDILPGWRLTLDVTETGYWFKITDTRDPCGFAFVSNHVGTILTAQPIR